MFVVRRSSNPSSDLARAWSAWNGEFAEHPLMLSIDEFTMNLGISYDDDADEAAEIINDETPCCVCKCPATGLWGSKHHDGLSAYKLEAETLEGAVEEARSADHDWLAGGCRAINPVAFYHVRDDIYVFECTEIGMQADS